MRRGPGFRPAWWTTAAVVTAAVAGCGPAAPGRSVSGATPPLVTAAPIVTTPPAAGPALALDEARKIVFRVRNQPCLETGTAFAMGAVIVTNRHVAAGSAQLQLSTWDGRDFSVPVVGHDDTADLAELGGSPPGPGRAVPATADPAVGTTVYVAGYPEGNQLSVSAGQVVATTDGAPLGISGQVLELSDRVQPGNSGSPVIDAAGHVVGVVFALDTGTGEGLAMPVSTLLHGLSVPPDPSPLPCIG